MALSQKHRSSLYRSLVPIVGEEETEALLSQFPTDDLDVAATKDFVRAEAVALRSDIAELRTEVKADITELRTDVSDQLRQMTVWFSGALIGSVVGGMGVAVGIASLV